MPNFEVISAITHALLSLKHKLRCLTSITQRNLNFSSLNIRSSKSGWLVQWIFISLLVYTIFMACFYNLANVTMSFWAWSTLSLLLLLVDSALQSEMYKDLVLCWDNREWRSESAKIQKFYGFLNFYIMPQEIRSNYNFLFLKYLNYRQKEDNFL